MINNFLYLYNILKNILYPPLCVLCEKPISDGILCSLCKEKTEYTDTYNHCLKCGIEKSRYTECDFCAANNDYSKIRTIVKYNKNIKKVILDFKYNRRLDCGDYIVNDILEHFPFEYNYVVFDYITCIPTHFLRFANKGYNHMGYISDKIGKIFNIPVIYPVRRRKYTKNQTKTEYSKRNINILDSFESNCKYDLKNKNILLIEDVITTGSTIKEYTKVLKKTQANIYILSYADARHLNEKG